MSKDSVLYPEEVDITNCDQEPIHIIGKSQAHGVIVACHKESFQVSQLSENTGEIFGIDFQELLGKPLEKLLTPQRVESLKKNIQNNENFLPEEVQVNDKTFVLLPHISEESLVLDFEPLGEIHDPFLFQRQLTKVLNNLRSAGNISGLCREAAALTREILGYDRVMIYRFDEEWNGEVIAEEKNEGMESWLGLHYPASDIPSQSRGLFLKHRVRIISDVNYTPIPIIPSISPLNNKPLDLSRSELRGVSPIHIEYLQNMGVGASLTAAIVVNGKLWGLVACHHYSARFLNYYQRETCRFLTQMFSNELALKETNKYLEETERTARTREKLVIQVKKEEDLGEALTQNPVKFTQLVDCGGGAVFLDGKISRVGKTPEEVEIYALVHDFLNGQEENIFASRSLLSLYPKAEDFRDSAAGIISARIGENKYLLWFRPEKVQTVNWGGNPDKKFSYDEEKKRISPRKSFEKWSEKLQGISEAWRDFDLSTIQAFWENVNYLLVEMQRNEISDLNQRLLEANKELELFSYGLSHDLRAPLRGIHGYAQILKEDHFENISQEGRDLVDTVLKLTDRMDVLIDDILSYSRLSSKEMRGQKFSVNDLLQEVTEITNVEMNYPSSRLEIQENMPEMQGDKRLLFQLWSNLLNNALKYSRKEEEPFVQIGATEKDGKAIYFVKDNGIGIDPEYANKIFKTFSRLAGKDYEGSGIGLALVKRILEKHNGKIWVESEAGSGSAFYFYLGDW